MESAKTFFEFSNRITEASSAALEKAKARLRANVSFELTMELLFLTIQENT